jgi:hypothetical protein
MSQFRVEKRRAEAEVTLATGATVRGSFFLAGSSASHVGPERVADLLNAEIGFFPFAPAGSEAAETVLINRAHVVSVRLLERGNEPQLDPGYVVATERHVAILLSTGERIAGAVRVYRPQGRDRLSDYARSPDMFRYVENCDGTFVVNSAHIVELRETAS